MTNLSQPTPFQTAAMAALEAVENREAERQARKEAELADALNIGSEQNGRSSRSTTAQQSSKRTSSSRANPAPGSDSDDLAFDESDYDSSDSFCLVPSKSNPGESSSGSRKKLKKENAELKDQLDALRGQVTTMHRQMAQRAEQDQQLKDQIMRARSEVIW